MLTGAWQCQQNRMLLIFIGCAILKSTCHLFMLYNYNSSWVHRYRLPIVQSRVSGTKARTTCWNEVSDAQGTHKFFVNVPGSGWCIQNCLALKNINDSHARNPWIKVTHHLLHDTEARQCCDTSPSSTYPFLQGNEATTLNSQLANPKLESSPSLR